MPKKIRSLLFFILSLTVFIPFLHPANGYAAETFSVAAQSAISVDFKTGKVFFNQDADTPHGIASITKIIGLYLVEQQVAEGKLKWEDQVPISKYAAELSVNPDLSNVPLHEENKYTVKELFDSAIIQSANASMVALGEKIAGSEPKFVDMMKELLTSWGIKDATLVNSSGLNNSYLGTNIYPGSQTTDENLMSAKDVAIIARHLLTDYPAILETTKITTKMFGENTQSPVEMVNWNWMLPGFISAKEGVDGLKTGTTDLAGACFVGTMQKNDQRIITVVLNATDHKNDPSARFVETAKLMDYTYDNWKQTEVTKAGAKIPDLKKVNVNEGKKLSTTVSLAKTVTLWVRNDMDPADLTITPALDKKSVKNNTVQAPVKKDKVIGQATVALKADDLGYLDSADQPTSPIAIDQSVEKANFFVLLGRNIKNFFNDLF